MEDCIFCKIGAREIPSNKVFENENIIAFLDARPAKKGHTLVVPKKHFETIQDVPDTVIKELFTVVKKVIKAQRNGLKAEGNNIGINNGSAAGQEVMHAHIHVIPRNLNDGLKHWPQKEYNPGEAEKITEDMKTYL